MLLPMAKSITHFSTYPTCNSTYNKPNCTESNSFIFFGKSSRRTSLLSLNLDVPRSTTAVGVSALLDENAEIRKFCEVGDLRNAVELLRRSKKSELDLNTYCSILQQCAEHKCLQEGKVVHSIISSNGVAIEGVLGAKLVFMYVNCGELREGRRIFDQILNDKVFLWNLMMSEYLKVGDYRESIHLFRKMQSLGVTGNSHTFPCILKCLAAFGRVGECKMIHGNIYKLGLGSYNTVANSLISAYFRCGEVDSAHKVFDELADRDVVSWNSMISGSVMNGFSHCGLEFFIQMLNLRVGVDLSSLVNALVACASIGSLSLGRALHGIGVKASFSSEVMFNNTLIDKGRDGHNYLRKIKMDLSLLVYNALMDMYVKCGSMEEAHSVFSQIPVKDVVSWNTMIGGYSKNSLPNEALKLFAEMHKESRPDDISVVCVLPACGSLSALKIGKEIHGYMLRNGYSSDLHVATALVDMYAKCGSLVHAQVLFDMIPEKDLISWTIMIAGYCMHGSGNEAISTFHKMMIAGIKPNEITFTSILHACSHFGLLNEGWEFFNSMTSKCNIKPKLEHYGCIVDLLARAGNLSNAYRFIETMPVKPDAAIWGSLLRGCRIHHDVKLAEKVAEQVFELEPENTEYYVLLADIYEEAEKWEKLKKSQQRIGKEGLKKKENVTYIPNGVKRDKKREERNERRHCNKKRKS